MDKVKIVEIAEDAAKNPKEVLEKAKEMGIDVKNITSTVSTEIAGFIYEYVTTGKNLMPQPKEKKPAKAKKTKEVAKEAIKTTKKAKEAESKEATTAIEHTQEKSTKTKSTQPKSKKSTQKSSQELQDNTTESNTESTQITSLQEPLSKDSNLMQRNTGIRIIKKTNDDEAESKPQATQIKKTTYMPSIQEMMREQEEPQQKKSKNPKNRFRSKNTAGKKSIFLNVILKRAIMTMMMNKMRLCFLISMSMRLEMKKKKWKRDRFSLIGCKSSAKIHGSMKIDQLVGQGARSQK